MPEAPIYQLSQELVDTIIDDLAELLKDWPLFPCLQILPPSQSIPPLLSHENQICKEF